MDKDQPTQTGETPEESAAETTKTEGHIRLRQDTETRLTTRKTSFGSALYLYVRSNDSVDAATIGQDYLAFHHDEHNLVFAVCDGVGQSFMGDLAARIVGDGLNDWLWNLDKKPEDAEAFSEMVTQALNDMTSTSAKMVEEYKLPATLPPLIVAALEMQRKYGSESMFVAGRLALSPPDPWLALCWLGDSPVAAVDINGKLVDLGPKGHTSERWNATTGVKGPVHTWVSSAEKVARVAGYTDGLGVESVPTDADLAALMERWLTDPPGDDASLFDVRLAPSPETTGPTDPEELEGLKVLTFEVDETRPITIRAKTPVKGVEPIEAEALTPVKDVEPIAAPPETSAVEEWLPLTGEKAPEAAPPEKPVPSIPTPATLPDAAEVLSTLSSQAMALTQSAPTPEAQQQIQMWQQAALLGLTSAALAMLMVERLIKDEGKEEQG
ncbi:MAG: protein phosphatase 2C domain-containing protein [Anaerolineae bacterium]|nr:protein phosphatase 2C domain-containing protein [Anaerolineae bacterium]